MMSHVSQLRQKSEVELYEYASGMVAYDKVFQFIRRDLLFAQVRRQTSQQRVNFLGNALVQSSSSSGAGHNSNDWGGAAAPAATFSAGPLLAGRGNGR